MPFIELGIKNRAAGILQGVKQVLDRAALS